MCVCVCVVMYMYKRQNPILQSVFVSLCHKNALQPIVIGTGITERNYAILQVLHNNVYVQKNVLVTNLRIRISRREEQL